MSSHDDYEALRRSSGRYTRADALVALKGTGRRDLLSHYFAKATAFALSGTAVESVILDDTAQVRDVALAIIEDDRVLLVSERPAAAVVSDLMSLVASDGFDAAAELLPDSGAVGVEGPTSWAAVSEFIDDDISAVGLGEVRDAAFGNDRGYLIRTGTTAEYGYLVVSVTSGADTIHSAIEDAVPHVGDDALMRTRAETNYPLVASQCAAIAASEAGAVWLASPEREERFRGRDALLASLHGTHPATIAARTRSGSAVTIGTPVHADGVVVGSVTTACVSLADQEDLYLVRLEPPFAVPGLRLRAGDEPMTTVSRPAIEPDSWSQVIG